MLAGSLVGLHGGGRERGVAAGGAAGRAPEGRLRGVVVRAARWYVLQTPRVHSLNAESP